MPHFPAIYEKYKSSKFEIVTVCFIKDEHADGERVIRPYPYINLRTDEETAGKEYGVYGGPTNFLLDPEGRVVFKEPRPGPGWQNALFMAQVDEILKRYGLM